MAVWWLHIYVGHMITQHNFINASLWGIDTDKTYLMENPIMTVEQIIAKLEMYDKNTIVQLPNEVELSDIWENYDGNSTYLVFI